MIGMHSADRLWSVPSQRVHAHRDRLGAVVHEQRLAAVEQPLPDLAGPHGVGLVVMAHAVLEDVARVPLPALGVPPADADVAGGEHLAQLVADEVDDRLQLELGGHALLDAVDHREFGVALLGLLQQALRLVEQARVLERRAQARDHGLQQAHGGLVERVLALEALDAHLADVALADHDRHVHARARHVGAGHHAHLRAPRSRRRCVRRASVRCGSRGTTRAPRSARTDCCAMRTPCSTL